ncbi:MAG TPA: CD225/dispanin family protein [Pseudonocardiaceae bacterium]
MSHYPDPIPYEQYGPYGYGGYGAGGYGQPYPRPPQPPSNLAWAIATTVLCCWPLSIVAIIAATKVERAWLLGDYAEARRQSDRARNWSIASAAVVVVLYGAVVALGLAGVFDEGSR